MKYFVFVLAFVAASCVPPKPGPPPRTITVTVTDGHQPILGAVVLLDASDPTGTHSAGTDAHGIATLPLVPALWRNVQLTITATGCQPFGASIDLSISLGYTETLSCTPPRLSPPEVGRLHVEGTHFYNQAGQPWEGRSLTSFLLCARLWAGQSIAPQLAWAAQHGFNTVRTFGPVNWPDDFARGLEMVPSADQLDACFSTVEAAGLRIEYTPITYAYDLTQQRALVQTVFDVAAKHWGVFVEVANEPEPNGVDPVAIMQGVDRHGVLAAFGLDPERVPGPNYFQVPVLDYATSHDLARDEAHSPRNSKDTRDAEDVVHVPVWDDEPIGVIDPTRYNFHQTSGSLWERPGGGSVRTTNCDITTAHAAIALALTGLTTYHSQAGLEGRIPADDEPIQAECGRQIGALGSILTADAQLGSYSRPGIDWPLTWTAGDVDSLVAHAYASVNGGVAYVVVPMPAPGWTLQTVDNWRVDRVGAQPWIARLVR
jgi:hypothetical protein